MEPSGSSPSSYRPRPTWLVFLLSLLLVMVVAAAIAAGLQLVYSRVKTELSRFVVKAPEYSPLLAPAAPVFPSLPPPNAQMPSLSQRALPFSPLLPGESLPKEEDFIRVRGLRACSQVRLVGKGTVYLMQSDKEEILVQGASDKPKGLSLQVNPPLITISQPAIGITPVQVILKLKQFTLLEASGMSRLVTTELQINKLTVKLTGDCCVEAVLHGKTLQVDLSDRSWMDGFGQVEVQEITARNHSRFQGMAMPCRIARVKAFGESDVSVSARDSLDFILSKTAKVAWTGKPKLVKRFQ